MAEFSVPLRSTRQRRAQALQKLNHAIPAIGLFLAGQQAIRDGHSGFGFYLGIFEIVSSAALIVLFVRELRAAMRPQPKHPSHPAQPTHPAHHGIDWVDIAAGFVLVAEALEHWHLTHHIARPTIVSAISTFALGLFHGRIAARAGRRRVLRVTDEGLSIGGRLFKARTLRVTWADLEAIEIAGGKASVKTRAGRIRKLNLTDLEGADHVRAALDEAQRRMAIWRAEQAPIPAE